MRSGGFEYWGKRDAVFGERRHWKCSICGAQGSDDPPTGLTAEAGAARHLDKVRVHYNLVRLEPQKDDKRNELLQVMIDEMSIFGGQLSVHDCSVIGAKIGKEHYAYVMKERDAQIASLLNERNAMRAALSKLIEEARGTLREPGWTLRDELAGVK